MALLMGPAAGSMAPCAQVVTGRASRHSTNTNRLAKWLIVNLV
jgi:hypothetical protein